MRENIFADLYNKVISFFVSNEETAEQSKIAAKNRLKTVLLQDRAGFSERAIQMLKDDMLLCISKYMDIEEDAFELEISPNEDKTVLELSIPVLRAKTDEEIDEAIKQDEERQKEKAKEIVEQLKDIVEEKVQELTSENEENEEIKEEEEVNEEEISEEIKEEEVVEEVNEAIEEDIEETLKEDEKVLEDAENKEKSKKKKNN